MSADIFRFEVRETHDDDGQQLIRGLGMPGEELVRVHRVMPHGLASHAPVGAHGIAMAVNGRRDQVVMLGGEMADKRPRNQVPGGTTLYDAQGNVVSMTMAGGIKVRAAAGNAEIEAHGMKVIISAGRIDLGGTGGPAVQTVAGPSSKVFAVL